MKTTQSFQHLIRLFCTFGLLGIFSSILSVPAIVAAQAVSTVVDVGDAPDGTNSAGLGMFAYPAVPARFPTSLLPAVAPFGPRHINAGVFYHLGNTISNEFNAEQGVDQDGINNIVPVAGTSDNDADDGLIVPTKLPHCTRIQLRYRVKVTNIANGAVKPFVNLWFDWNRNGGWDQAAKLECPGAAIANEWAVQNHQLDLPGPGSYLLTTPAIVVWNEKPTSDIWLRMTLSDVKVANADGSGPENGYARGETEDYRIEGAPSVAFIPPNPQVNPYVLDGNLTALPTFKVDLPFVATPKDFDPPLAAPGGKLKEVDVAHLGGSPGGPLMPIVVSAVGTGATIKLSSWNLTFDAQHQPVHLQDSPHIVGYDARLHVLAPEVTPDLSYSLLISAHRDTQRNLWLTTWRINADGTFTELDKRGYGSNINVDVEAYAIAHRGMLSHNASINSFQVVTPIVTSAARMRLITWSVNPTTGAINGLQDSGDWGNPAPTSQVDITAQEGDQWVGPYYTVSYRGDNTSTASSNDGYMATHFWEVLSNGTPISRGSGLSGVDIRGDNGVLLGIDTAAIAPLNNTGFVSFDMAGAATRTTSWDNQPVICYGDGGCVLSPHLISDDTFDNDAGYGVETTVPSITADSALLVDTLGATEIADTETLYSKGGAQQGIASVTKVMTLIVALEAVANGEVALNDDVIISQAAADLGGSQMGLEEGEVQSLRSLLHGLMMVSGNDAARAIAEYVGGTHDAFVDRMNDKASDLGMAGSIYCQSAGGCFSNPSDQVQLWLSVYQNAQFQEFSGTELYDACGTLDGADKCYFLERDVSALYPGLESWKGGSLGFFCDEIPNTVPLCASGGCLSAQATRLEHTLVLNELQPSTKSADRWNDAYDVYDYGFRQLFTPDLLGSSAAEPAATNDFAFDNIGDTLAVSAVIAADGRLKLCSWQVMVGLGQVIELTCTERAYTNLPGGSQEIAGTQVDIRLISQLESDGDYLTGQLQGGNVTLRVWRIAETP